MLNSSSLKLPQLTSAVLTATAATAACIALAASLYVSTRATVKIQSSKRASSYDELAASSKPKRPRLLRIRAYFNFGYPGSSDITVEDSSTSTTHCDHSTASECEAHVEAPDCDCPSQALQGCTGCEAPGDDPYREYYDSGLLISDDLFAAVKTCRDRVARISRECRADNRRFRDIEFDIVGDKDYCLHTLSKATNYWPTDVQRVTDLYDEPRFFVNEADPNDIVQGGVGDCWFLSALSALSTIHGLIPKLCVARDEEVGVYAFIFRKNGKWVPVIVDDFLYTQIPVYDRLSDREKCLYKEDREKYKTFARKGGECLYFARSGREGETWVPLMEKAFAKLNGSYGALHSGLAADALEDLTGGVTESWKMKDILDTDRWWTEELLKAGKDRFFDVSFPELDTTRSGANSSPMVEGLMASHAYTVLRAKEVQGHRFIVIRNPWGDIDSKWSGRWSDGSKEWTPETVGILKELGHTLGSHGFFIMEYCDFLSCFEHIQRTVLLDSTYRMSQHWLNVPPKPDGYPYSFGEAIFSFTLTSPSKTSIVLSQLDQRSFEPISGRVTYSLDFVVCRRGEKVPIGASPGSYRAVRNAALEMDLEEGEYVVYPRIDRYFLAIRRLCYFKNSKETWDQRKLSRAMTARAEAMAIASFDPAQQKHIPRRYASEEPYDSHVEYETSSTSASQPSGEENPAQCTLNELSKHPEDREMLVVGLQVYARGDCVSNLSGWIPPEGLLSFPIAAV
ncbi:calpain [Ephemerocybe angulata]|uniref:Calpain n=1 Tax=Ephemerocybe angulata TaxID=980116 RepID=A0A8H6I610_9AGAR|nr:calpain [Tulosesus angulatus]